MLEALSDTREKKAPELTLQSMSLLSPSGGGVDGQQGRGGTKVPAGAGGSRGRCQDEVRIEGNLSVYKSVARACRAPKARLIHVFV